MPYGSLLVGPAGDVLAEDRNTVVTERDITAHPELKLARWAARELEPGVGAADHDVHELPAVPHVHGRDRAVRPRARGLRALRRAVGSLRPPGAVGPDAAQVAYEGPALFAEARVPIDGYYG